MTKNKLLNLLQANATTNQPLRVVDKEDSADIYLYSAIGDWFGEVSANDFVKELNNIKSNDVHLYIDSPGGDVFEARSIATNIKRSEKNITAHIDGLCASAATYIATSCNSVEMAEGTFFMIHKAWTLAIGNSEELLSVAEMLDKVDSTIAKDFTKKTGLSQDEVLNLMSKETWLTDEEALEKGFVDSIFKGGNVGNKWNLDVYDNVPENALKVVVEPQDLVYNKALLEKRLKLAEAY